MISCYSKRYGTSSHSQIQSPGTWRPIRTLFQSYEILVVRMLLAPRGWWVTGHWRVSRDVTLLQMRKDSSVWSIKKKLCLTWHPDRRNIYCLKACGSLTFDSILKVNSFDLFAWYPSVIGFVRYKRILLLNAIYIYILQYIYLYIYLFIWLITKRSKF